MVGTEIPGDEMELDGDDHRIESLEATVVNYDDAPDECTIYPRAVRTEQRTTVWLSAKEGSYCGLLEMR